VPNDAVVVVANGETLKLFRNKGAEPHIRLVELPSPDLDAHNHGSGSRHRSSTANPDGRRLDEDNFAAAVAEHLKQQVLAHQIGALFVIADPRTLGELRLNYHASVSGVLAGELAKDLTQHSVADIETALGKA
jgi:protein required for attachment to host cells